MMSSNHSTTMTMLENSSNRVSNRNTSNMRLNNPIIREYFEEEENAKNKGYIDENKIEGNVRILAMNPLGCKLNDQVKIHELKKLIQNYNIDVVMLNKTNTKQNTMNISRIEWKMKKYIEVPK